MRPFHVPNTPLRLRVPEKCPQCGTAGRVNLESTIKSQSATLKWCCRACGYDWPIENRERELPER